MLIRPKDYMNNGKPQTITESDSKQCFRHILSPRNLPQTLPLPSPPLIFFILKETICFVEKANFYVLCFFSGNLIAVRLKDRKEQ